MYFLFSGEGSADCGSGFFSDRICETGNFEPGPMMHVVDQLVHMEEQYSPLDSACFGLILRAAVKKKANELKPKGRTVEFTKGAKPKVGSLSFKRQARATAWWAKQWARKLNDEVVAIYFRDSDERNSSEPGAWQEKYEFSLEGFAEESFSSGVSMIPCPTSEAWFICALKSEPYQNCERLEDRAGSENSKESLKKELSKILGKKADREALCDRFQDGSIDVTRIEMRSFTAFRNRFSAVLTPPRSKQSNLPIL